MTDRKVEVSLRVRPAPSLAASTVAVGTSGVSVGGSAPLSYAAQIVCGSDQQASFDALAASMFSQMGCICRPIISIARRAILLSTCFLCQSESVLHSAINSQYIS